MYGIGLQLTSTTIIGGSYSPTSLFAANEPGVWFDNNDAANLNWRYNFATGSALPGNAAYWNNSGTANGVTVSTSGFGTGVDGLPFIDYSVTGTATANTFLTVYGDVGTSTRVPATTGQTYTTSFFAQVVGGVEPPALCGVRADVIGETSPSSFVEQGNTITAAPIVETLISQTYTFANAATNQARCAIVIRTQSGVTVNYTLRIKAVQFERNFVRTTYQPITDVTTEVRERFPNATLYQDIAGTLPVTTPGQSVALALDKSRGLALGAELVTNGDFSNGTTGWSSQLGATLTAVSGGMRVTGQAATAFSLAFQTVAASLNNALEITWTATVETLGSTNPRVGVGTINRLFSTSGQYRMIVPGNRADNKIDLNPGTDGVVLFDNISVRELAGNHATQATTASRPLYALLPANGVRNLANGSADVGNAGIWPAAATVNGVTYSRVGSGVDVDGLPYNDWTVVGTATALSEYFGAYAFGNAVVPAISMRQFTGSLISRVSAGTLPPAGCGIRIDVAGEQSAGVTSEYFGGTLVVPAASDAPVNCTATLVNAASIQARPAILLRTASGVSVNYTIRIKGLQFERGAVRTAYQFNYSNVNIAQPPFTQVGALLYDGVDDFMATPAINFESYTWDGQARRNLALGSAQPANEAAWPVSTVRSGVTATKVGSGFDADGLPYVDLRYQGTASGTFHELAFSYVPTAASTGQSWTCSAIMRVIGGSTANITGLTARVQELDAADGFIDNSVSDRVTAAVDTISTSTNVIGTGVKARALIELAFTSGATIDVTYRVKALQFELGATRTTWQGTGTDKVSVFAGVRKTSDADSTIAELTASADATNGAFGVYANAPGGPGIYQVRSRGTTLVSRNFTKAAPDSAVFTLIGDISAPNIVMRYNGTQVSQSNATQGTGNYSNSILYIGSRGSTSMFFRGYMYEIIARGALTEANLLARTETSINQQTGAY